VEQRRKAQREARQAAAAAYQAADWVTAGEEEQLAKMDEESAADTPAQVCVDLLLFTGVFQRR
jgi:hypothetical protein